MSLSPFNQHKSDCTLNFPVLLILFSILVLLSPSHVWHMLAFSRGLKPFLPELWGQGGGYIFVSGCKKRRAEWGLYFWELEVAALAACLVCHCAVEFGGSCSLVSLPITFFSTSLHFHLLSHTSWCTNKCLKGVSKFYYTLAAYESWPELWPLAGCFV